MPASAITGAELAIRAGFNTVLFQSNQTNSSSFASDGLAMIDKAKERIETFVKSSSSASSTSMTQLVEDNMDLIQFSMKAAIYAYQALSNHMQATTEYRKRFEEELQLNIATFTIPGNVESMKLSKEHQAVEGFLKNMNHYPALFAYSGVKNILDTADSRTQHMCALPLFSINQLEHPSASPRDLDQSRISISLFFNSKAMGTLQKIADIFRQDNRVEVFFKSMYEAENYLNDLRAPRLILTMLLNILWNLQYPVDCKTGYSLPLNDSIKLCSQFNTLLNIYLADKTFEGPYQINSKKNGLYRIIRHIELKANNLHLGYIDEKLRQFNLKNLTNNAHLTLRALDTSLFQLIFKKTDNHPNKQAALDMADSISVLNDLLDKNAVFFDIFDEQRKKIPDIFLANTFLNTESSTVIDALILFCHLTSKQRQLLIHNLNAHPDAGEDGCLLAGELSIFEHDYILPLEKPLITESSNKVSDPSTLAKLLALKLLPLFTLAVADFRIKVDTRKSLNRIKETTDENGSSPYYSGNDQVQMINNTAQEHSLHPSALTNGKYMYHWSISPYLILTPEAAQSIDNLPSKQYRMTQITELLDYISELTLSYKSFLQYKTFQTFLLECLQQVDTEYRQFAEDATLVEQLLSLDGKLDRALKNILQTMITQLSDNLSAFRQTIDEISHIVGAPDFTELRKQELDKHIKRIEKKFIQLFGRTPVNFTNTYQQILFRTDVHTIRSEREVKAKQFYEFVLAFFTECKQKLTQHQPLLPMQPHFLSKLKQDKITKYLSLIDHSIEHVERLKVDGNFLLDPSALFCQLQLIDESKTFSRTEEQFQKSTFCQVILEELKRLMKQQTTREKTTPIVQQLDSFFLYDNAPLRRTNRLLLARSSMSPAREITSTVAMIPLSTFANGSRPSSVPAHSSEQEDVQHDRHDQQLLSAFAILKNELKSILQIYISSKEHEQPTHWFFQILHVIKNWFGYLSKLIYVRLLDTKIEVARKVLDALESTEEPSTKLTLSSTEMETLSNGTLGNSTFYFRAHAFWNELAQVEGEEAEEQTNFLKYLGFSQFS